METKKINSTFNDNFLHSRVCSLFTAYDSNNRPFDTVFIQIVQYLFMSFYTTFGKVTWTNQLSLTPFTSLVKNINSPLD